MDAIYTAFFEELEKLAALTPEEKKLWQEAVAQQQKFDQMSTGRMTEAQQAAHRANTERLKLLIEKKTGKRGSLPGWAKSMKGAPPEAAYHARPRPQYARMDFGYLRPRTLKHMAPWAGAGFAIGGLAAITDRALQTKSQRKEEAAEIKRIGGPISRFKYKHPVVHGSLLGSVTVPAMASQLGSGPFTPHRMTLAGVAPAVTLMAADRVMRVMEDKRKKKMKKAA